MVFKERVKGLRELIREKRLSCIIISNPVSAEYISSFSASSVLLYISLRTLKVISDFRYREAGLSFCRRYPEWEFVQYNKDKFKKAGKLVSGLKKSIGIQSDSITLDEFERLKKYSRRSDFVKLKESVSSLYSVKGEQEIKSIKEAASIGDRAFDSFLKEISYGMTERDAAFLLEDLCRKYGSEKPSFGTIVLFGSNTALPHGKPSSRRLKKGDTVLCDFGCTYMGLCSDMSRTFFMGRCPRRMRDIYNTVNRAGIAAESEVRAGVKTSFIDKTARFIIESCGYGKYFGHATGHGVGREVHERPGISSSDRSVLKHNMVFTIEPGIYINNTGGVRIEDMCIAGENGVEIITNTERDLKVV